MYTPEERKARFLRKMRVKLAAISEQTGLSRDRVKEVTRDIWLEQQKEKREEFERAKSKARIMREEDYTLDEIAKEVGHSRDLVREWVSDIEDPTEKAKRISIELRSQGWKTEDIAKKVKRSQSSVIAWTSDIAKAKRAELDAMIEKAKALLGQGMPKADVIRSVGIHRSTLDRAIGHLPLDRKDYDFLASEVVRLYKPGDDKNIIAEQLEVSIDFVRRHTRAIDHDIMVDDDMGVFIDKEGVSYYNCKYLAARLNLSKSSLYTPLRQWEVPYKLLPTTNRFNTWQKFYKMDDVLKVPRLKLRKQEVDKMNALPSTHMLRRKPDDLTAKQFRVFCTMLLWKNQRDSWPKTTEIAGTLDLTENYVQDCLANVEKKGYFTTIREETSNRKKIVVHKGPPELITRQVKCANCDEKFYVARDYVVNGAG